MPCRTHVPGWCVRAGMRTADVAGWLASRRGPSRHLGLAHLAARVLPDGQHAVLGGVHDAQVVGLRARYDSGLDLVVPAAARVHEIGAERAVPYTGKLRRVGH